MNINEKLEKDYTATIISTAGAGALLAGAIVPIGGLLVPLIGAAVGAFIGKELEDHKSTH